MLCPKCSAWIGDDCRVCPNCGAEIPEKPAQPAPPQGNAVGPPPGQVYAPPPQGYYPPPGQGYYPPPPPHMNTYLTQNILLTVFSVVCCLFHALPTSVVGLVFSSLASGALRRYDQEGAKQHIKIARIFMWISFGLQIATVLLGILGMIFSFYSLPSLFDGGPWEDFNDFDFDFRWF